MATFTNRATLTFNGGSTNSNTVTGELVEVLTATKTAIPQTYRPGDRVTYVVTLVNTGTAPLTGLTVQDNLGAYTPDATTLYPLTYESALFYQNGVLQPTPAVTPGPPLSFGNVSVPAGGNATLVYDVIVNEYASPLSGGTVEIPSLLPGTALLPPLPQQRPLPLWMQPT